MTGRRDLSPQSPQDQRGIIERWVDEVLVASAQRGRHSKPPPDYEEMLKWAKRICHSANLSESGLMVGDPYSGSRAGRGRGGGRLRDQGTTSSEEQSDGGRG